MGLRFCARAFSSCGKWGPLFITVHGPPTIAASPVAEHRLQTRRLSNCGSRAQPLGGMWDLPRPGPEPVSPASAGRFSTTAPPGKPRVSVFNLRSSETSVSVREHTHVYFIPPSNRQSSGRRRASSPANNIPTLNEKILFWCFRQKMQSPLFKPMTLKRNP